MAQIKRVDIRHVESHVRRAITKRRGHSAAGAVIDVMRDAADAGTVILHVNSGGNADASERHLRSLGYRVERTDYDPFAPGHYGIQLRVGPAASPSPQPYPQRPV